MHSVSTITKRNGCIRSLKQMILCPRRECIYAFLIQNNQAERINPFPTMHGIGVIVMTMPNRKLPRLKDYDYSTPGAYFITICTHNKQCLLGHVTPGSPQQDAQMHLSTLGKIVKAHIIALESHYENIKIDNWIIMPNHVHLLIRIEERINPFPTVNIPNIVGKFKAGITRSARQNSIYSQPLWQKSYHDHIIRTEKDYLQIWQYIRENAGKWSEDCFYCD